MAKGKEDLDSFAASGILLLMGIANLKRSYLLSSIVALTILRIGLDSLAASSYPLSMGLANLKRTSLTYRYAIEGSSRVKSGIRSVNRVFYARQTNTTKPHWPKDKHHVFL